MTAVVVSGSRERLIRRLALLLGLSHLCFSETAHAKEHEVIAGVGLFIGYSLGDPHKLKWGVETYGTAFFNGNSGCGSSSTLGVGPLLQWAMVQGGTHYFTLGSHGGLSPTPFTAAGLELGATYRPGKQAGFGMHVGGMVEALVFYGALRGELFLNEHSMVTGNRFWPTYLSPAGIALCPVEGRPLRTDGGEIQVTPCVRSTLKKAPARLGRSAEAAGLAWERAASHESASVPTFLQLAITLLCYHAPDALVERALDAACEEMLHAELCAGMASKLLGLRVEARFNWNEPFVLPSLTRVVQEAWLDGCLGEATAARRAQTAAHLAQDAEARAVQRRIARDEAGHAALSWQVLEWALRYSRAETLAALSAVQQLEMAAHIPAAAPGLEHYGQLSSRHADLLFEAQQACAKQRLLYLIS